MFTHKDLQDLRDNSLKMQGWIRKQTFSPQMEKTLRRFSSWEVSELIFKVNQSTFRGRLAAEPGLPDGEVEEDGRQRWFSLDEINEMRLKMKVNRKGLLPYRPQGKRAIRAAITCSCAGSSRRPSVGARLATSAGDVPFAHANLILPMRAPAMIRQAGLGERWAAVKLPSFQSQADERVYVIGDSQGTPLPKSGHVAFGSGQQVAEAITDRIAGKTPAAATGAVELPLGICWANVTHKDAININVSSSVAPGEAPKLKFTVDPEHNARSGAAATSWGNGMWKAMLG